MRRSGSASPACWRAAICWSKISGVGKTTLAHGIAQTRPVVPAHPVHQRLAAAGMESPYSTAEQRQISLARSECSCQVTGASPKAQSALLEAMVDAELISANCCRRHAKPRIRSGPLRLELDRFLMRVHLGYPPPPPSANFLSGVDRRDLAKALQTITTPKACVSCSKARRHPCLAGTARLRAGARRAPGLNAGCRRERR